MAPSLYLLQNHQANSTRRGATMVGQIHQVISTIIPYAKDLNALTVLNSLQQITSALAGFN